MSFDLTPLYRSTVGFDRLFEMLDDAARAESWPPYNVAKAGEDHYRVAMAVAGFSDSEIQVVQQGNTLVVSGQKHPEPEGAEVLHRGIATRAFKQTFKLADHVTVTSAVLGNGLLTIELKREVPEALKPRRIEIAAPGSKSPLQDNTQQPLIAIAKAA
ncbi:Hsp20 family protein [Enterovirga aerilata]|uniref:Hsp20 family protein n=1 Tax=Enterovirga aerilata TaxID=2730920 RepID=A0A849IA90_9HYPH|nr:Hsp20 family protein [Enterovirga sp. DB1703]NNM74221.1 Hsp20 family protein [Enterovirga sp. DB1703]